MRTYDKETKQLIHATCNCCGRELPVTDGILTEDACLIDTCWGYFSKKDLERHCFDLCETCYDKIVSDFVIAPKVTELTEF